MKGPIPVVVSIRGNEDLVVAFDGDRAGKKEKGTSGWSPEILARSIEYEMQLLTYSLGRHSDFISASRRLMD